MQGFEDFELTGGQLLELNLMSNRGIQVMNPSRFRLNFYRDSEKKIKAFAMVSGMYCQVFANMNISGAFFVEPIGLADGEKVNITINLM